MYHISDKIRSIWHSITFGTKFVLFSSILCYLIDVLLNDMLFNLLIDKPDKVLQEYQFWRLLVPQFFHGSLFSLTVSILGFCIIAVEYEKNYGTVPFFYDIFFKNLIIQIVFIATMFAFSFIYDEILEDAECFGFWCLTLGYMINKALSYQEETSNCLCLPISIDPKYYPTIFFIILNILEFPRLDMCATILLALFEFQFFDGFMMKPSKNFVNRLEQSFLFNRYQSRPDFITCDQVNQAFIFKEFNNESQQNSMEFASMEHTKEHEQLTESSDQQGL